MYYNDECCQVFAQLLRSLPDLLTFASDKTIERFCGYDSLDSTVHHYEDNAETFIDAIHRWRHADWVSLDTENNVTFKKGVLRADSIVSGCYVDRPGADTGLPDKLRIDILQLPVASRGDTAIWDSGGHDSLRELRQYLEDPSCKKIGVSIQADFTSLRTSGVASACGEKDLKEVMGPDRLPAKKGLEQLVEACGLSNAKKPGISTEMDFEQKPLGRTEQIYCTFDVASVAIAVLMVDPPDDPLARKPEFERPPDILQPPDPDGNLELWDAGGNKLDTYHFGQ